MINFCRHGVIAFSISTPFWKSTIIHPVNRQNTYNILENLKHQNIEKKGKNFEKKNVPKLRRFEHGIISV